jgi:hypothetical protein
MVLTHAEIRKRFTFELVVLNESEDFVHGLDAIDHFHEFLLCLVNFISAHFVN